MADTVHIPEAKEGDGWYDKSAAWAQPMQDGKLLKPIIRCNCGQWSGIGLHHVHADGRVTASFFHARRNEHPMGDDSGCGWHVFLILDGYAGGDWPPNAPRAR